MNIKTLFKRFKSNLGSARAIVQWPVPNGASDHEIAIIKKYRDFSGANPSRLYCLVNAVNYVDENEIPGDIVECGVFRGVNPMMVKELRTGRGQKRLIHLFDTFEGMTEPTSNDVRYDGTSAATMLKGRESLRKSVLSYCSVEDVKRNFARHGLDLIDTVFVKGRVEDTLLDPHNLPEKIAILRLDTDWYASTKIELEVLYPRLVPGGVIIIDDYGYWRGSREAVDEFFGPKKPLLSGIDSECRIGVKPGSAGKAI